MKATEMLALILVFALCGAVSAYEVSWNHMDDGCPANWSIITANPTTAKMIHFSGPTELFGNDCYARNNMGDPMLLIDQANKTIELSGSSRQRRFTTMVMRPRVGIYHIVNNRG